MKTNEAKGAIMTPNVRIQVSVTLDPQTHAWLMAQHESTGAPMAFIIRKALESYRAKQNKKQEVQS